MWNSNRRTSWRRTGATRIIPWYFGIMRAEFEWRRDTFFDDSPEIDTYEIRWRGTGRLPDEFDGSGPYGFLSTWASKDPKFGERSIWSKLIQYFPK